GRSGAGQHPALAAAAGQPSRGSPGPRSARPDPATLGSAELRRHTRARYYAGPLFPAVRRFEMLFETISGRKLDLYNILPSDIDIFDIAHSLSRQCRFSGHCVEFYSVAQHSLRVAELLPTELKMVGL